MRKLKEWKNLVFSKIREHKKQTAIAASLVLLLAVAGTGAGVYYYAYLPDQVSEEKTEDTKAEEKQKDTKNQEDQKDLKEEKQKEEQQSAEEQKAEEPKNEEEKKETATQSESSKETPSTSNSTEQKSNSQSQPSKKQDTSSNSKPAKPSHTHKWVAQTTTKQYPAEGHNETVWVQDSAAWDEPIYEWRTICSCGADITNNIDMHYADGCGGSYSDKQVQTGTKHHPATGHNETKWVQDKAAWTETIVTGYKCSCGATK